MLHGLDIRMKTKSKSPIECTDVSNYPHVGWHGVLAALSTENRKDFHDSLECWVFTYGLYSFSVKSLDSEMVPSSHEAA